MTTPTQTHRVLRALLRGPVSNVAAISNRMDGKGPVLRLAARCMELRQAGHDIRTTRNKANGTATYKLIPKA